MQTTFIRTTLLSLAFQSFLSAETPKISFNPEDQFALELQSEATDTFNFEVVTIGDSLMHNFYSAPTPSMLLRIMNPSPSGMLMDTNPNEESTFSYIERLTQVTSSRLTNLAVPGSQVMKSENAFFFTIPSLEDQVKKLLQLKAHPDLVILWIGHNDISAALFTQDKQSFYDTFKQKYVAALQSIQKNLVTEKKLKVLALGLGNASRLFVARKQCLERKTNDPDLYPNYYDASNNCKALEEKNHEEAIVILNNLNKMIEEAVLSITSTDRIELLYSDKMNDVAPDNADDLSPNDAFHPSSKGQNKIAKAFYQITAELFPGIFPILE